MVVSLKSASDEKDERDSARAKWLTVTKPFPLPEISLHEISLVYM